MIKRERRAEKEEETSGQRKKDVRRRRRQRRRGRDQNKKAMNSDKLRLNGQVWQCLVSEKEEDQDFFWGRHNCNDRNQRQAQSIHKAVHTLPPLLCFQSANLVRAKVVKLAQECWAETVHRAGKWLYGTVCDSFCKHTVSAITAAASATIDGL